MNKLILLGTIAIGLTTSCSNSNQSDHADSSVNQIVVTNDTGETIKNKDMIAQKITPCLWVEKDAKAVVDYYLSIFKDGKLKDYRQFKDMPKQEGLDDPGSFETAVMEIQGMEFSILAAGPMFKFNEALSLVINCKDQSEVDYYWDALTKNGGEEGACGWCKDKYGLSWQVVPVEYFELIHSDDPAVRGKALLNTFKQKKLILSELK